MFVDDATQWSPGGFVHRGGAGSTPNRDQKPGLQGGSLICTANEFSWEAGVQPPLEIR